MKFVFTLISVWMMFAAVANPLDSIRSEQREEGLFIVHEVEDQETIYSIARRYGGSVIDIIKHNQIIDNRIEIGQVIYVLVEDEKPVQVKIVNRFQNEEGIHMVELGETLYSISKQHDVKLKDLRKWNNLPDNNISPGMRLRLTDEEEPEIIEAQQDLDEASNEQLTNTASEEEVDPFADFEKYLVQTGETLSTISKKIGVHMDSLKEWNDLNGDYIKIGQNLFYKKSNSIDSTNVSGNKNPIRTKLDEKGFERIYEEGVASVIETMNTSRFLALHRTLPIGTNLKVRNLMNNQVVHVKVVGRLPNTGLNKNLLLRLSQPAYDQLGILDSKSRVEVSYNKQ